MTMDSVSHCIQKLNSKWKKDLNIRLETLLLEENIGENLLAIGLSNYYLDITTKAKIYSRISFNLKASAKQGKQLTKCRDSLRME